MNIIFDEWDKDHIATGIKLEKFIGTYPELLNIWAELVEPLELVNDLTYLMRMLVRSRSSRSFQNGVEENVG